MTFTFASVMEVFITPITVLIGLLGNALSICVLRKKEIQLRDGFARILIALAIFDIIFISASGSIFSLPALSTTYTDYVYPYIVPFFLPLAQISMTASVYTTVITCFDRYIAICRPALLGCCGRSEEKTSWCLIGGTAVFSVIYNITRFFEFKVDWLTKEMSVWDPETNTTISMNQTKLAVQQTDLRSNPMYIQWYILITNFIFMGICPSIVMIVFNVLVVRAVNEANKKRAKMTKRQQRNITVTSMLVSVVVVFLVCHSFKLIISGHEVYQIIMKSQTTTTATTTTLPPTSIPSTSTSIQEEMEEIIDDNEGDPPIWPPWVDIMTIISHWLLILNSSSNIAIYLRKDPKFKAVLKKMVLSYFNSLKDYCSGELKNYSGNSLGNAGTQDGGDSDNRKKLKSEDDEEDDEDGGDIQLRKLNREAENDVKEDEERVNIVVKTVETSNGLINSVHHHPISNSLCLMSNSKPETEITVVTC